VDKVHNIWLSRPGPTVHSSTFNQHYHRPTGK